MTYNPAIPGPNDLIAQSQAQIQTNFSQADTIFDINHVTFDDATVASRGKHRKVDYIRVAAPGSLAAEAVTYQKLSGGSSNLFMQRDAVATEVQLTGRNPSGTTNGETFLPGGFLLKWGSAVIGASPTAIAFPVAFPNNCFSVSVCINNNSPAFSATVNNVTKNGFDLYTTKTTVTHFYIAIGN